MGLPFFPRPKPAPIVLQGQPKPLLALPAQQLLLTDQRA